MLDGADVIYVYDGSFEGLLTAVFEAYAQKRPPVKIGVAHGLQPSFGAAVITIETDEAKAERVIRGICQKLGLEAYEDVQAVYLSEDEDKATIIYRYLRYAFAQGRGALTHLANSDVMAVYQIARTVQRERHATIEFLRFAQLENGVYFAKIHPKNSVVPLIMPHFAERYNDQPFIIYDEVHQLAGVYDMNDWMLVESDQLRLPGYARGEADYRKLWRLFYDAIAIKERVNPKLRRNLMPKRFWRDMLEMNDSRFLEELSPLPGGAPESVMEMRPVAFIEDKKETK